MTTQVTGFRLREAIRRWELRRDTAINQFDDSLLKFEDEDKPAPDDVAKRFTEAEVAIAKLQAAQSRYNLAVEITVLDEKMTLCEGVKRLGGAGRLDKKWREAAGGKKDRHSYRDESTRNKDEIRAKRTVSVKEAMARANKAAAFAGELRAAIAKGNGTEIAAEALRLDLNLLTE